MTDPRFFQLENGRRLAYAEYGDPAGRPVIFLQGTPGSRLVHPDDAITKAHGARLVTIDRPGFGWSDFQPGRALLDWPDDVAAIADHLGFDRFAIVGLSGGGPYTAACAYKIPHRITTAFIAGGAGPFDAPGAVEEMTNIRKGGHFVATRLPGLLRPVLWLFGNPRRNPQKFFKKFSAGMNATDQAVLSDPRMNALFPRSYAEATRQGLHGLAHELKIFGSAWGFDLADIRIPIHLWHGEEDYSTPVSMGRYMASLIPDCRARFLPGEGHLFLFPMWQEIIEILLAE